MPTQLLEKFKMLQDDGRLTIEQIGFVYFKKIVRIIVIYITEYAVRKNSKTIQYRYL